MAPQIRYWVSLDMINSHFSHQTNLSVIAYIAFDADVVVWVSTTADCFIWTQSPSVVAVLHHTKPPIDSWPQQNRSSFSCIVFIRLQPNLCLLHFMAAQWSKTYRGVTPWSSICCVPTSVGCPLRTVPVWCPLWIVPVWIYVPVFIACLCNMLQCH